MNSVYLQNSGRKTNPEKCYRIKNNDDNCESTLHSVYYVLHAQRWIFLKIGRVKPWQINLGSDKKHHLGISVSYYIPYLCNEKGRMRTNPNSKHSFKIQIPSVSRKCKI